MECPDCGSKLRDDARFCMDCGAMLMAPVKVTAPVMQPTGWESTDLHGAIARWKPTEYLGSAARIPRFIAWVIDQVIVGAANAALIVATGKQDQFDPSRYKWEEVPTATISGWLLLTMVVLHAAYFIIFAATTWQATPGKRLVSIRVTDASGNKIGLVQSAWRYVCQVFVLGIFVPIAMVFNAIVGWFGPWPVLLALLFVLGSNQKQSPWDMLAGTRVLE